MIRVLTAGFYTTVQDLGRIGFAHIGVPVSGVMDGYSAQLANQLLSNDKHDAVLEITFGNATFLFEEEQLICITGANFLPKINDLKVALNVPIQVQKGAVLSFGKQDYGVRTYVAVKGGFKTEKVLHSRSYYKGVTKGSWLQKGMLLPVEKRSQFVTKTFSSVKINEAHFQSNRVCCYQGPEYHLLSEFQQEQLKKITFTISKDNSRMGYRLEESVKNDLPSMLTSAVLPGTVQLTPSGKLIVLMRDCQVTGGYPRVLQLSNYAIDVLAQKTTGAQFTFELVSL
ncbi:MAG: biotin-dependent carboxyltransferase family protein [Polaribacter sp.]|nr:biotin-dependent carboxyltransferase family protein [Polaribacter sp.]